MVGLLRDLSGGYSLPFYACIALELVAAALIMVRGRSAISSLQAKQSRAAVRPD